MCSPMNDLTRSADGRWFMCTICFEWIAREELFRDKSGQLYDICVPCARNEGLAQAVATEGD